MLQVPNLPNYIMPQQPNYNAVKIDIHNPSVGGGMSCPMQQPQYAPQYAPVTNPYYSYPQAQLYDYPVAPVQPQYYMPQQFGIPSQTTANAAANATASAAANAGAAANVAANAAAQPAQQPMVCPPCPVCGAPQGSPVSQAAAAQQAVPVQQVNINQAPPAPVIATAPEAPKATAVAKAEATASAEAPAAAVEVSAPVAMQPQVDVNAFLARLVNPDFEVQANAMEEIANMVKDEPQKATELLDAKIVDSLVGIMNFDSSKLAGPTQEQIAARQKLMSGQQISDQDKSLATTITPMEQAERNKSYAMFTAAILEKLYGDEVAKLTGTTVPLPELPAAVTIVDHLKDNPNPMVRTSAIEALSYIQNPEYKKDLTTLFTIAKNDQDKDVQEAASAALEKLNQV